MAVTTLRIEGMHCGHCVGKVSKALAAVPGVNVKKVEIGSATVEYDAAQSGLDALAAAVRDAGYETGVSVS